MKNWKLKVSKDIVLNCYKSNPKLMILNCFEIILVERKFGWNWHARKCETKEFAYLFTMT